MPRVVHFEIHADSPPRAMKFYSDMFGWTFQKFLPHVDYWAITTGPQDEPGIDGGLKPRKVPIDGQAVIAFVCTVEVESLDAAVAKALACGGTNVVPKMPIPGIGWLAYCKDTEGNIFGMMQPDHSAQCGNPR
jgi:predicted enzyme related to lactoylglutathione lyase